MLSAALAVGPSELLGPGEPQAETPDADRTLANGLRLWTYTVMDTATLQPGQKTAFKTLFPPIPKNFLVTQIGWMLNPRTSYRDSCKILEEIGYRVQADGREMMAGPISSMPITLNRPPSLEPFRATYDLRAPRPPAPHAAPVFHGHSPYSAIAPKSSFSVELSGDALPLEHSTELWVMVGGIVRLHHVQRPGS